MDRIEANLDERMKKRANGPRPGMKFPGRHDKKIRCHAIGVGTTILLD